jgi:hypothetical protein
VNVCEAEREQSRIIEGNFVVRDWRGLLFEVPRVETGVIGAFNRDRALGRLGPSQGDFTPRRVCAALCSQGHRLRPKVPQMPQ